MSLFHHAEDCQPFKANGHYSTLAESLLLVAGCAEEQRFQSLR
jgi:hypothetical protein